MRFKDRLIVITGGASGIGEACARKFAEQGGRIVITDIHLDAAQRVTSDLDGHAIELDVRSDASVETAAESIENDIGPVNTLVTSAGVLQPPHPPHELEVEEFDRVMNIDQRGTFLTCRAFGTRMARRGAGAIVNIASVAGLRSTPLHSYTPAKAAVISLTECLAAEWGRSGVRVNAVSPGHTLTRAMQAQVDSGERDLDALASNTALGKLVTPDDIADAVCFLASDDAKAITGASLPIDAGWLAATSWHSYGGVREKYDRQ
tara:strand:+ start:2178 stop:2963 length:786 start_codon:yes stop_codon:yes gene_type:complete